MPRGEEPATGRIIPGSMAAMPYHLLQDHNVAAAAKIAYLALRHNAWAPGPHTWRADEFPMVNINRTYLLQDTGLGREAFRRALDELVQHGWIAVMRPNEHEVTVNIGGHQRKWKRKAALDIRDPTIPHTATQTTYMLLAG